MEIDKAWVRDSQERVHMADQVRFQGSDLAGSMDSQTTFHEAKSQEGPVTFTLGVAVYESWET
jgi:hypothetical protein